MTWVKSGETTHWVVFYLSSQAAGPAVAAEVLANIEADHAWMASFWTGVTWQGGTTSSTKPGLFISAFDSRSANWGGINNAGVNDGQWAIFASFATADQVRSGFIAELTEEWEFMQNKGLATQPTEGTNGEALSQFMMQKFWLHIGKPIQTGGWEMENWLNGGREDGVNYSYSGDYTAYPGQVICGVVFLNYLCKQLGFSINQIIAAGAPTYAQVYRNLTGRTDNPFSAFMQLLDTIAPIGTTVDFSYLNDVNNPFPIQTAAMRLYVNGAWVNVGNLGSVCYDRSASTAQLSGSGGLSTNTSSSNKHAVKVNVSGSGSLAATGSSGGNVPRPFDVGKEPWRLGGLTDDWPSSALSLVRNYVDAGHGFVGNLDAMCAAGPVIVKLPAGTFHISSFPYNGVYGYYNANLRGLLGAGAQGGSTGTTIKLDANSLNSTQLSDIQNNTNNRGSQHVHIFRLGDGGTAPTYMSGIRWIAADQQNVSILGGTSPAPINGLAYYHPAGGSLWQNFALIGFGRAGSNSPPYETGAIQSGNGGDSAAVARARRFEIDGRTDATINANRPRRSGGWMLNAEANWLHEDMWMHHTGRSGYAWWGTPQTPGKFVTRRTQIEHDSNVSDGLGGNVTFSVINHEAVGSFTHDHGYFQRDGMKVSDTFDFYGWGSGTGIAQYVEPTWAGQTANDNGCFSISVKKHYPTNSTTASVWYTNASNWIKVTKGGVALKPYLLTSFSYTAATLQAAGVTAKTHFLIKVQG